MRYDYKKDEAWLHVYVKVHVIVCFNIEIFK